VQEGDTLTSIARQHYNNPAHWQAIYDLNRKVIGPDPGVLKTGMRLRLKLVDHGA
jgi:nucleoid-associated protein YgaU